MSQPVTAKRNNSNKRIQPLRFLFHPFFADVIIGVLVFLTVYFIVLTAVTPERYELKAGDIPSVPIAAPRDIEDKLATEEAIELAKQQVNDIYTLDQAITTSVIEEIEDIFNGIDTIRGKAAEKLTQWEENQRKLQQELQQQETSGELSGEESIDQSIQQTPVGQSQENGNETDAVRSQEGTSEIPDPDYYELYDAAFIQEMQEIFPLRISEDDIRTIIMADQRELNQLKQTITANLEEMMGKGIKQEQLAEFKSDLRDTIQAMAIPNELKLLGFNIAVPRLKANLLFDPDKTLIEKNNAAAAVEKVIYKKGQFIVQAGQPITESQILMLSELGLLENNKVDISFHIGVALSVIISISIFAVYLIFFEKSLLYKPHLILLSGVILCLVAGLTYVADLFNSYLMPSAMAGILITILINHKAGVVVNIVMTLLAGLITGGQLSPAAMTIVGGLAGISMLKSIHQRSTLIWAGIGVAICNILFVTAFEMLSQGGWAQPIYNSLWAGLSGLLTTVLTIGTLPIWETLFGVVTPIKLIELGNPNHPLLKRLLVETPGTYHHSIIVANLAESAADAIGGNGLLARVGAYYHDIGKLEHPYFFKENQLTKENPHDRLEPELSARIITSHVTDGVELAKRYKVPAVIQDFIREHHGTQPVIYFYHKAKNQGEEVALEDFCYSGPKPQSKETAIVMMADTVEAAVRAMTDYSASKVETLIRKLIRAKFDDEQFDECDLTIKDMNTIAVTFKNVISGIFHERVEYPAVDIKAERAKLLDEAAN
jgi:putative nucleotidyltransferase with HDIG domain